MYVWWQLNVADISKALIEFGMDINETEVGLIVNRLDTAQKDGAYTRTLSLKLALKLCNAIRCILKHARLRFYLHIDARTYVGHQSSGSGSPLSLSLSLLLAY